MELSPKIFDIKINKKVIHQVVLSMLGNQRHAIADTKSKGEVRGGGKKPWKQKGTGRARHGSIRSPLWRGGGIIFGPRSEKNNYTTKINKKVRRLALFMALSDKAADKAILVIEDLVVKEGKTKEIDNILKKIKLNKVLLVIEKADALLTRATRNIVDAQILTANSLNVLDVLKAKDVLFTKASLKMAEKVFLKAEK